MNPGRAKLLVLVLALAASGCASGHHATPATSGKIFLLPGNLSSASLQSFWGERFEFLPAGTTRVRCRIPGPLGRGIDGACQMTVAVDRGLSVIKVVSFTEFWPAKRFRTHGPPQGTLHHTWRFAVKASGGVKGVGDEGDLPPQASD
jgi:hypothetical protein